MLILPLSGLLAVEATVAALLCIPFSAVTRVALFLTGLFKNQVVGIVLATSGALLVLILVFSGLRLRQTQDVMSRPMSTSGDAAVFHEARQEFYLEGLQSCIIVCCLLLGMMIIRIDEQLRRNKKLQANFDVMLKQAKGTQQEYMRQLDEINRAGGSAAPASSSAEPVIQLKKENSRLKDENDTLQREIRTAGASLAALKKQTEGLQLEFNRLIEENEDLRSQLSIFDRKYSRGDDKKRS